VDGCVASAKGSAADWLDSFAFTRGFMRCPIFRFLRIPLIVQNLLFWQLKNILGIMCLTPMLHNSTPLRGHCVCDASVCNRTSLLSRKAIFDARRFKMDTLESPQPRYLSVPRGAGFAAKDVFLSFRRRQTATVESSLISHCRQVTSMYPPERAVAYCTWKASASWEGGRNAQTEPNVAGNTEPRPGNGSV
jgi:hypothetical protein